MLEKFQSAFEGNEYRLGLKHSLIDAQAFAEQAAAGAAFSVVSVFVDSQCLADHFQTQPSQKTAG